MRDFDDSSLWRISAYERMRAESGHSGYASLARTTLLPTTLHAELQHLQRLRRSDDAMEVVAACMRQRESALVLLKHRGLVWPLTLFPREGLYHLPRSITDSIHRTARDLAVIAVEPPGLRPPGHPMHERVGAASSYHPLPELMWALSMLTPRAELLEEIAGRAAYRLAADFEPDAKTRAGVMGPVLRRLRNEIASLAEISRWPGMDAERATRLLNAVYLQGGLMVLRTHRSARNEASVARRLLSWWRQ